MTNQPSINKSQQAAILDPVVALDRPFVLPEEELEATHAENITTEEQFTAIQSRMNFRIKDIEMLCADDASREVVDAPKVNRLPNTASWFKGLANVRGGMTPVVDLAAAMGLASGGKQFPYLMIFGQGDGSVGVLIDDIPSTVVIESQGRLSKAPGIAPLIDDCVIAAYDLNQKIRFDLDIERLFTTLSSRLKLV